MARTQQGALLTDLHRRQQLALRAAIVNEVMRLFPMWQPKDPASYARFEDAMVLLAQIGGQKSAALAAAYYQLFRLVDATGDAARISHAVVLAAPPVEAQVRASVLGAARGSVFRALGAGQSYERAMANGLVEVSGTVGRLALNSGDDTITESVKTDRAALGWARVTGADSCAFCAMLASRGPVYKEDTVYFKPHIHCSCTCEAHYQGSEWPGRARQYETLWKQTGSLNSFRQALTQKPAAAAMAAATT